MAKVKVGKAMHESIIAMLDSERGEDRLERVANRHIRHRSLKERIFKLIDE